MRINVYLAQATGLSRRAADKAITEQRVSINGHPAELGSKVDTADKVTLDGRPITPSDAKQLIMLNKPVGYVCSRDGQGSPTIYDLLPAKYKHLKPVGRLDKDSSGLLLLTNDGGLANQLSHPRHGKTKIYEIMVDKPLTAQDRKKIEAGVQLEDGLSRLKLDPLDRTERQWRVTMGEGRNRQIRRTFAALNYSVVKLHRTTFGEYMITGLKGGSVHIIS